MTLSSAGDLSASTDQTILHGLLDYPKINSFEATLSLRKKGYKARSVLRDMLGTFFGQGKLHPREFFYYRLFDQDIESIDKKRFVGSRLQNKLHMRCNSEYWFALADNKELFYAAMKGYGLKVPETLASLRSVETSGLGATLKTSDDLVNFLFSNEQYPIFAKPTNGMFSLGAVRVNSVDKINYCANINFNQTIPLNELLKYIFESGGNGYLFQELIVPHPLLVEAFGTITLPTIRFLVILAHGRPEIISAVCRVPANGNIADNYWRNQNVLSAIDLQSGAITRAITGSGLKMAEVEEHPNTNKKIVGMVLPDWEKAKDLCLRAAGTLPGIHTQSWDIALTNDGPVVIEVNFGGDLNLHQLAHKKGLLNGKYLHHLQAHGVKIKF